MFLVATTTGGTMCSVVKLQDQCEDGCDLSVATCSKDSIAMTFEVVRSDTTLGGGAWSPENNYFRRSEIISYVKIRWISCPRIQWGCTR